MNAARRFATIAVVTFDAGGTLLAPHPSVGSRYREIALRHGCAHDAAALDRAFRLAFGRVSKSSLQGDPEARERDFWRRIVLATFAEAGPPALPPDRFDAFFEDAWETLAHGGCWRLLPDALVTIQSLRARGYRLGVLSNWDHRLHRILAETGLAPGFDHVLISSEVGAEKPDAGIFRAAERVFRVEPGQCLHVGDSPQHDRDGAEAAGWHSVLVRRDDGPMDGEHDIHRLADLLALLRGPAG